MVLNLELVPQGTLRRLNAISGHYNVSIGGTDAILNKPAMLRKRSPVDSTIMENVHDTYRVTLRKTPERNFHRFNARGVWLVSGTQDQTCSFGGKTTPDLGL